MRELTQPCQALEDLTRQPGVMESNRQRLSNVVRFELPSYADVDDLAARIRPRWTGSTKREGDVWLVTARVRANANDLARLLREVEIYVAEAGLLAIRFRLDGRFYLMEAAALDRAAAA